MTDLLLDAHLVVRRDVFLLDARLRIHRGETVALLGPNGAGKTTALRALAGLTPLTAGHLSVDGQDLHRTPPEERPIGVVFQDYLLFPHLTARDNVAFGPRRHGADRRTARAIADRWLDRVGLAEHGRRKPRHLSGGQAQRVAIGAVLTAHPRVLVLDEPTSALDVSIQAEVLNLLAALRKEFDLTYILVSHDLAVVAQLCHSLAIMRGGEIVETVNSEMLAQGRVSHPYSRQLLVASKGFNREAIAAFADF